MYIYRFAEYPFICIFCTHVTFPPRLTYTRPPLTALQKKPLLIDDVPFIREYSDEGFTRIIILHFQDGCFYIRF